MNEIEKLYENAGIEKQSYFVRQKETYNIFEIKYPPFTAEKQLELIKFLMEQEDFSWIIAQQGKDTEYAFYVGYEYSSKDFREFTEALAGLINNLWQDLTEEEKEQIRGILK